MTDATDMAVVKAAMVETITNALIADEEIFTSTDADVVDDRLSSVAETAAGALLATQWLAETVLETSAAVVHEIAKLFSTTNRPHMAGWLTEVAIALRTGREWPVLEPKPPVAADPPLRHAPDADLGRVAYEAYVRSVGGVSVAGDPLPTWIECKPHIATAWAAAAKATVSAVFWGKDGPA